MSGERETDRPALDATAGLDPAVRLGRAVGTTLGRYSDLQLVGYGGMAAVYRAKDPTLGRTVALKLLRGDDPALAERLLVEARAQARIQHENVCPIYEAGVEEGHPFIAMQYVDGVPLKALQDSLSLEQKLTVVREVAEAVHAAHRVGLVHRDLKPSNVMVERAEDGRLVPYVMDFGLAREVHAPGLTVTGMVLGTPWYMSPEQARGESRTIDRRADVYSLGATLYELLAGKPPFEGDSNVTVLMKLLTEEPVPLALRDASLPRDVQTIVMKCLEREPARRYDSARALAEDLGRYLDGEPIEARPPGLVERLVKRGRKHAVAVTTAAVAFVLVLFFAVLGLRARAQARTQARLAAEFARTVKDAEWIMRVAHMAPLHDIRREKAQVRERLVRIESRMRAAGALARGPGEYALGRGQLVLDDPEAARKHLERAWESGYRTPDTAYALGLALGALYRRELELAASIGSRDLREARRLEVQRTYRDPAIAYLRQSAGSDVAAPEYVEGLLALHEKRHPEALAKAAQALARVPWLYEARLLEGDVHVAIGREKHETGDEPGSRRALEAAEAAYRAASSYARSEPLALEGFCQLGVQRAEATLYERRDLAPVYDAACRACEEALAADPERAEVHAKLANLHRFWANHLLLQGRDPLAALGLAADHARRAIALDPRNRRAHGNLGVIYRLRAQFEKDHGLPAAESLRQALESLEKAVELSGADAGALNDLGNAYVTRALAGAAPGGDARADLERAVASYQRALERLPDFGYAHANRGLAFVERARLELAAGADPRASLDQALASLEKAVRLLPNLEGTHTRLADAHVVAAEARLQVHEDPAAHLEAAREQLREAARLNPRPGPDVSVIAGSLALMEARALAIRGRSPLAAVAEAKGHFRRAAAGDPRRADPPRRLREAAEIEARWRSQARR